MLILEGSLWENYQIFLNDLPMVCLHFIITLIIISEGEKIGVLTFFLPLLLCNLVLTDKLCARKLRCPRNMLHLHLFVSFIMRAFMALLKDMVFVSGLGLRMDIVEKNGSSYFSDEVSDQTTAVNLIDTTHTALLLLKGKSQSFLLSSSVANSRTIT